MKEKINAIEQINGNTYKLEMAKKKKRKKAKEDKRHGKHLYSL